MPQALHALVLNLHQPAGNLEFLLENKPWEAQEILFALDRMPRSLWGFEDTARVHLAMSGTLLETLSSPGFQERVYGIVDCGALLWHLQNERLFSILGTGYYHPVLPLIPPADWPEHIGRWLGIGRHLFWREQFSGFWPPEMGFTMEMIPMLKRFGYRYVLVDSDHVEAITPMRWEELRYRPHVARYQGEEIVIVVRDRDLSKAQLAGMECQWFVDEIRERTRWCDFVPLVTTCTDGDNGGWFRNVNARANFWGYFYREFLDRARGPDAAARPVFIHEYIDQHGVHGEVKVHTGAWNTEEHSGHDFTQWQGSDSQRQALARVAAVSHGIHDGLRLAKMRKVGATDQQPLQEALWHLLRAETSCNFYWGEAWVPRAHADLDAATARLAQFQDKIRDASYA